MQIDGRCSQTVQLMSITSYGVLSQEAVIVEVHIHLVIQSLNKTSLKILGLTCSNDISEKHTHIESISLLDTTYPIGVEELAGDVWNCSQLLIIFSMSFPNVFKRTMGKNECC